MWWVDHVNTLYKNNLHVDVEPPQFKSFPFDACYPGQNNAIQTIMQSDMSLLCSHTGSGKSSVFLTAAHELKLATIIIEPRKFLQKQIGEYYGDYCLYGRGNYPCEYAPSAASAPCLKKHAEVIDGERIVYFYVDDEEIEYPCAGCEYLDAIHTALAIIDHGGVVVVNFGNFWMWLPLAEFFIIDEMDEFFRSVTSGIVLNQSVVRPVKDLINDELKELEAQMESIDVDSIENAREFSKLKARRERLQFFYSQRDICFAYQKKDKVYVEIQPHKSRVLLDRLFKDKKVCGVTATPSEFIGGDTNE